MLRLETKSAGDPLVELKAAFDEHDEVVTKRLGDLERKLAAQAEQADRVETALNRHPTAAGNDRKGPTLEEKAFIGFLRRGPDNLPDAERKALTVGDNTEGGYLVTSQFSNEVLKNLVEFSPVRQAARVGSMSTSEILIPKRTSRPTAYWVSETGDRQGTQAAYGQERITAHEAACYVDVSSKLLEDAAVNVEAEVSMDLAEEFGRIESTAFVLGDGVGKPSGFMVESSVGAIVSGDATLVTADGLINLIYDLPAFYRNRGTWMMNGGTLAAIRRIKDGQGNFLWQPSYQAGQPETLLGRPIVEAVDMPDIGAGSFPIAFGDFQSAYRIYDRVGMSLLRDPFTQANRGLVRFHARRRVGAGVVKGEALRKLKIAAS